MEKYGVIEKEVTDNKQAEDQGEEKCPKCKATLRDVQLTGVRHCPKCGTEPFEER